MVIVDRDLKVVADTYHVDEGRTLISPKVVKCFKNGEVTNYRRYGADAGNGCSRKERGCPADSGEPMLCKIFSNQ